MSKKTHPIDASETKVRRILSMLIKGIDVPGIGKNLDAAASQIERGVPLDEVRDGLKHVLRDIGKLQSDIFQTVYALELALDEVCIGEETPAEVAPE